MVARKSSAENTFLIEFGDSIRATKGLRQRWRFSRTPRCRLGDSSQSSSSQNINRFSAWCRSIVTPESELSGRDHPFEANLALPMAAAVIDRINLVQRAQRWNYRPPFTVVGNYYPISVSGGYVTLKPDGRAQSPRTVNGPKSTHALAAPYRLEAIMFGRRQNHR